MTTTLLHGNCLHILPTLPDCSVDSVVTDPPYELGFMGKDWDNSGIAYRVDLWREVLRVLKPGGHLLAFGGTRTYHRMAVAIENAGFEIRDSIHWIYGSGFPKSLDVSKAIDKQRDDCEDIYKVTAWIRLARDAAGIGNRDIDDAFGANGMGRHWTDVPPHGKQPAVPTLEQVPTLLEVLGVEVDDVPEDIRRLLWDLNGKKGQPGENWAKREVIGTARGGIVPDPEKPKPTTVGGHTMEFDITTAATDAAKQWEGWGTALKPAHEPIVVARRPLIGTVAANVLEHGTGALNIDGCRVGHNEPEGKPATGMHGKSSGIMGRTVERRRETTSANTAGRWPANVIFDPDAAAELDRQSGVSRDGVAVRHRGVKGGTIGHTGALPEGTADMGYGGQGGASRFFYVAKPSKAERNAGLDGLPERQAQKWNSGGISARRAETAQPVANVHPTVKPLTLMRYLVRLVTPPGGTVLEPFAGSGTTLMAAVMEGFDSIGIEMTDDYLPIIRGRVAWAENQPKSDPEPIQEELPL